MGCLNTNSIRFRYAYNLDTKPMKHEMMRLADQLMVEMKITYEQALEEAYKIMKGSNNGKQ